MNLQPPDPPDHGHCLTCKTCIDACQVRGDRCTECEDDPSTTNGNDDGQTLLGTNNGNDDE